MTGFDRSAARKTDKAGGRCEIDFLATEHGFSYTRLNTGAAAMAPRVPSGFSAHWVVDTTWTAGVGRVHLQLGRGPSLTLGNEPERRRIPRRDSVEAVPRAEMPVRYAMKVRSPNSRIPAPAIGDTCNIGVIALRRDYPILVRESPRARERHFGAEGSLARPVRANPSPR